MNLPLSYQHCKYNEFTSGEGAALVDLSGLPVNRCPEWTATADLNYTLPCAGCRDGGPGRVRELRLKNLDTYSIALPYAPFTQTYADSRTLMNASITYNERAGSLVRAGAGTNLGNKTYVLSSQNVDPLWVWSFYGEPRYIGGEVGLKFGTK